jgi:N-sulfoglucosamine sulfohydrolase
MKSIYCFVSIDASRDAGAGGIMNFFRQTVIGILPIVFMSMPTCVLARPEHPNILWLVSEDNDPFLRCYGDKFVQTPNLDQMASDGVLYLNAFANAPVCAPSRATLITGMYASTLGTLHMRSRYPVPPDVKFYCDYLREAGYYCMNPTKTDYNIAGNDKKHWDKGGSWKDAPAGKPWMLVLNSMITHESALHGSVVHPEYLKEPFSLPPYHPDTPEIRSNWVEYYHDVTKMDAWVGSLLDKLKADGLADDTIVFYYSDHGGILPRSKRFVYDSGLHVPLIIRFGKSFQDLAPAPPGTKLDRIVSFVDITPSLLSVAGIDPPQNYQGTAFFGPKSGAERQYAFGFRGRMDERYDLSYAVRDKQYRYIHNYMPHRIYGQHLWYLWKMPATVSWENDYRAGGCNADQSAFWQPKPTEEIYNEAADPYEVKNLIDYPEGRKVLDRMRHALREQMLANHDGGIIPEPEMIDRAHGDAIYTMTHDDSRYPVARVLDAADVATQRDPESVPHLIELMKDPDAAVRYWAAVGCSIRQNAAREAAPALVPLLKDSSPSVRIAAAEALCWVGHADEGLPALVRELDGKEFDVLFALNSLEALGPIARPVLEGIKAKAPTLPKPSGEDYTGHAMASLLAELNGATGTAN